jgi:predicted metalloprotease
LAYGHQPIIAVKANRCIFDRPNSVCTNNGPPEEEELKIFVAVLLASTEDVWHQLKSDYRDPKLTIFRGQTTIQLWKCFFMSSETISRHSKHRIYARHIRATRALVQKGFLAGDTKERGTFSATEL